jgi:hypothetical protein
VSLPLVATTFDERLARRVLLGEGDEVRAATTFLERHDPATLEEAVTLLEAYGRVSPKAFDHLVEAWSVYWLLRDTPCD